MSLLTMMLRYARTLPHLKPWQVEGRLVANLKRRVGLTRLPPVPAFLENRLAPQVSFLRHDPWNTREALLEGEYCFLDREEVLGQPVNWLPVHLPLLWQFNLHYFHYLHLLASAEQAALCQAWVRSNPVGAGAGWHPYPTSLRIVNWCRAGIEGPELLASLYRQAAFLYRNLETYVYGNHLLENARALVLAGCFFAGQGEAPRWLEKGLALYCRETPVQILSDGGHYERSPMYHALILEGYLDVLNVLSAEHADRSWLIEAVCCMGDALESVTHPDGQLALLNDATQEIAPPPQALRQYLRDLTEYEPQVRTALPETGYFIHRGDGLFFIIDGGPVGPDHLLAHAHADIFTYELSVGGLPFVVDSGVYEYPAGDMRRYVRGTAAHNTVCVDGVDQVECWGSFRVARRFAPRDVAFSNSRGVSCFRGTFSGYAALIGDGIRHHRQVRVDEPGRRITVEDQIEGRGIHRIESRIHLHPQVEVVQREGQLELRRGGVVCRVEADPELLQWEEGWYCPRFGVRERNNVMVIGGVLSLPATLSYSIHY